MNTPLQAIYRKDYKQPDYWIRTVSLWFLLEETGATVTSKLKCVRNEGASDAAPFVLDGEQLELLYVAVDGESLESDQYTVDDEHLTIHCIPATGQSEFTVEIQVRNHPQENKSMEGLYQSSGNFCTQCEAEGFRRITYFLDRPDVMATYTTTIEADREKYPVLLSNGNRIDQGQGDDGRHWVKWEDPFPKPSYLFALVAGALECHAGSFTTMSGRKVALEFWVEPQNIDACEHALVSLQKSMKWDEEVFGLEYDLDLYMIVAVGDFNMGAMENKGLNVFNTKYVLARPETATDDDYEDIERVVAHEYFHNWTGNRVTCRDWFQLTLKEGLTVFRDQLFSADMGSEAVNRIKDVRMLRTRQFAEDDGPMAHPIRPESYVEMNNFYTVTVYRKGAEVIRMYHTMLGADGFRQGMDLYFERHDNSAVECDDFLAAMADANGIDLTQFSRWYSQAGTPTVTAVGDYDADAKTYELQLTQTCRETPGLAAPQPFLMPVRAALVGPDGDDMRVSMSGHGDAQAEHLLHFHEAEQTFRFEDVESAPVVSLFRGFSSPVRLKVERSSEQLAFLFANDSDPFNRWDAGQELAERLLLGLVADVQAGRPLELEPMLVDAVRQVLESDLDGAMKALAVTLPSEAWLGQQMQLVLVDEIHQAREFVVAQLASQLEDVWQKCFEGSQGAYGTDAESMARRALKNKSLAYLTKTGKPEWIEAAHAQFSQADNMTDQQAALVCLASCDGPQRTQALEAFYEQYREYPLVVDKWFSIQASSTLPDVFEQAKQLAQHPAFNQENPNRVRSLLGAFCGNHVHFHRTDGAAYQWIADFVLAIDGVNSQVAASLVSTFNSWRRMVAARQANAKAQLERIAAAPGLSKDVGEIVSRSLGTPS